MIKHLKVLGLNGKIDIDLKFHEDINLLIGKNGSGKTTILKLIWYLISGNIEKIISEISFNHVELETHNFSINLKTDEKNTTNIIFKALDPTILNQFDLGKGNQNDPINTKIKNWGRQDQLIRVSQAIASISGSSIFFPTFRRIEGGFSIQTERYRTNLKFPYEPLSFPFHEVVSDISRKLTIKDHKFIASISTTDIIDLLTTKYANISEETNTLHLNLSKSITKTIRTYYAEQQQPENQKLEEATSTLEEIQKMVTDTTEKSEQLLKPFYVLSQYIKDIFQYNGIKVTEAITLGETKEAIASGRLSAGEQQMLSFLCYNAFAKKTTIFIDEPEISLHVDWQRILFPTLLSQSSENQFIIATHSPFIYSKYSDKELVLNKDRGE